MIAIMILGIGLVMVATVFPVGLDIAGDNIKRHITAAAANVAVDTLKTKVPRLEDVSGDNAMSPRVLVGNAIQRDQGNKWRIDPDADIDADDVSVLGVLKAYPYLAYTNWVSDPWDPGVLGGISLDALFDRVSVITEFSGWPAQNHVDMVAVLPSQNVHVAYAPHASAPDLKTMLRSLPVARTPIYGIPGVTNWQPPLPRVNIVDQLYPPVPLNTKDSTGKTVYRPPADVLEDIVSRRYNWTALHHRMSSSQSQDGQLVTIVITHRADLNHRYARQRSVEDATPYTSVFDLSNANHIIDLLRPRPDNDSSTDMLFPRPWLMMLRRLPGGGIVHCTPEAARLLPAGSHFVIARSQGTFTAGTAYQVKNSEWPANFVFDPGTPDSDLTSPNTADLQGRLQLDQGAGNGEENVLVWVFPPAIQRTGGLPVFTRQSPVAGVAIRAVE